jgi:hypothetical protein
MWGLLQIPIGGFVEDFNNRQNETENWKTQLLRSKEQLAIMPGNVFQRF